jgi:hypothetical protein
MLMSQPSLEYAMMISLPEVRAAGYGQRVTIGMDHG